MSAEVWPKWRQKINFVHCSFQEIEEMFYVFGGQTCHARSIAIEASRKARFVGKFVKTSATTITSDLQR